jgi:hypothetical protein
MDKAKKKAAAACVAPETLVEIWLYAPTRCPPNAPAAPAPRAQQKGGGQGTQADQQGHECVCARAEAAHRPPPREVRCGAASARAGQRCGAAAPGHPRSPRPRRRPPHTHSHPSPPPTLLPRFFLRAPQLSPRDKGGGVKRRARCAQTRAAARGAWRGRSARVRTQRVERREGRGGGG